MLGATVVVVVVVVVVLGLVVVLVVLLVLLLVLLVVVLVVLALVLVVALVVVELELVGGRLVVEVVLVVLLVGASVLELREVDVWVLVPGGEGLGISVPRVELVSSVVTILDELTDVLVEVLLPSLELVPVATAEVASPLVVVTPVTEDSGPPASAVVDPGTPEASSVDSVEIGAVLTEVPAVCMFVLLGTAGSSVDTNGALVDATPLVPAVVAGAKDPLTAVAVAVSPDVTDAAQ